MPSVETRDVEAPAETEQQRVQDDPNVTVVEMPAPRPNFKEKVYGYARLIHGKVLGQPDVKEKGEQVLRGEQGIPLRRGFQSNK